MSFSNQIRYISVHPDFLLNEFYNFLQNYGENISDGIKEIKTIAVNWNNSEHTSIRSASLTDGTIFPIPLENGMIGFYGLFQEELDRKLQSNSLNGVIQLSKEEFFSKSLKAPVNSLPITSL